MTSTRSLISLVFVAATLAIPGCGGSSGGGDGALPGGTGGVVGLGGGLGSGGATVQPSGGIVGAGGAGGVVAFDGGAQGGSGGSSVPACGQPGTPCCDGNGCVGGGCCVSRICMAENSACVTLGDGICKAGSCGACGGPQQPCCGANPATGSCTSAGTTCESGTCVQCGDLGGACCPGADGGTGTCSETKAICSGNTCLACGSLGSLCCAGNTCGDGCCVRGMCLANSACLGPVDAGGLDGAQPDAPLGGNGGNPGTGGAGGGGTTGTGGAGGTGGTTTPWTIPAGCGDLQVVAPEQCDDGNTMPFDGCSSDCRFEPDCSGASCISKCGDGLVIGEDCDDGNTANGDGCSSACTVEPGHTCAQPPLPDRILVPAVYRDFKFNNPMDFEAGVTGSKTASTGMVNLQLDTDGKPVFTGVTGGAIHVTSADSFAKWYRNVDAVNHATAANLVLWSNGSGGYVNRYGANGEKWPVTKTAYWCGYVGSELLDGSGTPIPCTYQTDAGRTDCDTYASQGFQMLPGSCKADGSTYRAAYIVAEADGDPLFFPVDDDPFSASQKTGAQVPSEPLNMYDATATWPWHYDGSGNKIPHNFSFTSEIRYWFKYETGTAYRLDIVGDDDVWVFVNKKLAVDLGGIHTPVAGSVTLDDTAAETYGLVSGQVYEVAVFQAERQSTSSTFKLTLAGFNTAPSQCHLN